MNKRTTIFAILGFAIVLLGVSGCSYLNDDNAKTGNDLVIENGNDDIKVAPQDNEPISDIKPGAPAPDFTLKTLDGDTVSLSDYQGKIVLLNFWATTCGYCVQEMPDLDKLNKEYEDVVVLAVDVMEKEDKVREFIEDGGYDFDVALDLDGQVAMTYLIPGFPTSYFIEEDGTLIRTIVGMLEYDKMVWIIENIKSQR